MSYYCKQTIQNPDTFSSRLYKTEKSWKLSHWRDKIVADLFYPRIFGSAFKCRKTNMRSNCRFWPLVITSGIRAVRFGKPHFSCTIILKVRRLMLGLHLTIFTIADCRLAFFGSPTGVEARSRGLEPPGAEASSRVEPLRQYQAYLIFESFCPRGDVIVSNQ